MVVFDEAYHGFGSKSQIQKYKKYNNVLITRSFSKSFGLTAIRLGILISNKKILNKVEIKRLAYETNIFSSIVCEYFIKNFKIVEAYNREIIKSREWLKKILVKKKLSVEGLIQCN